MAAQPLDAEPVASCEENGVLGPIVGMLGSMAALETIKAPRFSPIFTAFHSFSLPFEAFSGLGEGLRAAQELPKR